MLKITLKRIADKNALLGHLKAFGIKVISHKDKTVNVEASPIQATSIYFPFECEISLNPLKTA